MHLHTHTHRVIIFLKFKVILGDVSLRPTLARNHALKEKQMEVFYAGESWWTLDSRDGTRRAQSQKHLPMRSWAERVDKNTHK